MKRLDPRARRLLAAYGADRKARWHMAVRWSMAPLCAIAAEVPRKGRILDIGCGQGLADLYLADAEPSRRVHGVDVDAAKIRAATAAAAAAGLSERVTFERIDPGWQPTGQWDAVVVVGVLLVAWLPAVMDVLYLLGAAAAEKLVVSSVPCVAPGGRLVIKEMSSRPRWKHRWNMAQERVARRAGLTMGSTLDAVDPEQLRAPLERRGLQVRVVPTDRGYLHPHSLLVAMAGCPPAPPGDHPDAPAGRVPS